MKKILSFILGSIVALNLSMSVANSAAKEVRVAFFLEWPTPNQEDKVKGIYEKALGVPVKWTNFSNGGAMTDAMLAGDIDISNSEPFAFVIPEALDVTQVVPPIPYSIAMSTSFKGAFDLTALMNGTKPCE